jgi:hypothetical protein
MAQWYGFFDTCHQSQQIIPKRAWPYFLNRVRVPQAQNAHSVKLAPLSTLQAVLFRFDISDKAWQPTAPNRIHQHIILRDYEKPILSEISEPIDRSI